MGGGQWEILIPEFPEFGIGSVIPSQWIRYLPWARGGGAAVRGVRTAWRGNWR